MTFTRPLFRLWKKKLFLNIIKNHDDDGYLPLNEHWQHVLKLQPFPATIQQKPRADSPWTTRHETESSLLEKQVRDQSYASIDRSQRGRVFLLVLFFNVAKLRICGSKFNNPPPQPLSDAQLHRTRPISHNNRRRQKQSAGEKVHPNDRSIDRPPNEPMTMMHIPVMSPFANLVLSMRCVGNRIWSSRLCVSRSPSSIRYE